MVSFGDVEVEDKVTEKIAMVEHYYTERQT